MNGGDLRITPARIVAACAKVREQYRPCYPTKEIPKPKPCPVEVDLLQKLLPVMEEFAALAEAFQDQRGGFNTEPARDFVEMVEAGLGRKKKATK